MNNFIDALKRSIESKNWYGALIIALTIPDICSKLQNPDLPTKTRYPEWFDVYGKGIYKKHLTGNDCYALRCSLLHEGNHIIERQKAREIVSKFSFSPDGSHCVSFPDVQVGSIDDGKHICHLSVKNFSEDMVESAEKWEKDVATNNDIQERLNEMLKIQIVSALYGGAVHIS